jgi:fructoselysine 6-kinase
VAVATRGRAGALVLDDGAVRFQPSVANNVVDTLGAGDSFIARFLVGHLEGEDVQTTLEAAAQEAATTCASYGAFGYGHRYRPEVAPRWSGSRPAARHGEGDLIGTAQRLEEEKAS